MYIQMSQTFGCSNKSSPNSSCHFQNHKASVYPNFAAMFSVMKDNSSGFFNSNLIYFGQKQPIEVNFWTFKWLGENSPNFSCHISNNNSVFLKLCVSLKCHERQKKLYMIFTNVALKSAKFQSFNCSGEISPNLFFNRLLLLKVYKISAKKVQRSYVS